MSKATFGEDLDRTLASVLDELIPPSGDGRLPGAGELGLVPYLAEKAPELAPVIEAGIAELDALAAEAGAAGFVALSRSRRQEALSTLATRQPGFLPGLIFHTYVGYYQDGRVALALGLEDRPPFPKGYELEPGDFGPLDRVRKRPKLYREV